MSIIEEHEKTGKFVNQFCLLAAVRKMVSGSSLLNGKLGKLIHTNYINTCSLRIALIPLEYLFK